MVFLYNIGIRVYGLAVQIAALFHPKAAQWVQGRKDVLQRIEAQVGNTKNINWFHCASLGEFEQARPLIEKIKEKHPSEKILVTFFSPSGYELRKNYALADFTFYLPLDTKQNAKKFLDIINPKNAFFIKYELWHHYLSQLDARNIPTYLVAATFRNNQAFFKFYGSFFRKNLNFITHFFTQDNSSEQLMRDLNFNNVTTIGDTRVDRVHQNAAAPQQLPVIEKFKSGKKMIVAGSSWPAEEKLLASYINACSDDVKFIIAPHEVGARHIEQIGSLLKSSFICYSEAENNDDLANYKTLIIDNIGMLSNIYQYSDIAFVGGGFSGNLHNILEPASFGNALLFGPDHHKFHEAKALMDKKAAFVVKNQSSLHERLDHLLHSDIKSTKEASLSYILEHVGAADKILNHIVF